jgi:hypothetical protein
VTCKAASSILATNKAKSEGSSRLKVASNRDRLKEIGGWLGNDGGVLAGRVTWEEE